MHSIAWWPTVIVLAVTTVTDLHSRRIPNVIVLPFLVTGVVLSLSLNGWRGISQSLLGVALAACTFGIISLMGGMGMGDVKLCAAIGAWIGPSQLLVALVLTGIIGGFMAVCWAAAGGFLGELFSSTGDLVFGWKKRGCHSDPVIILSNPSRRKMPYAPAIALGTIVSFYSS